MTQEHYDFLMTYWNAEWVDDKGNVVKAKGKAPKFAGAYAPTYSLWIQRGMRDRVYHQKIKIKAKSITQITDKDQKDICDKYSYDKCEIVENTVWFSLDKNQGVYQYAITNTGVVVAQYVGGNSQEFPTAFPTELITDLIRLGYILNEKYFDNGMALKTEL